MRTIHNTPTLALATVEASGRRAKTLNAVRLGGARLAAPLCLDALSLCPATQVARVLRVSPDLVWGWGHGRSQPTLGDVLAGPPVWSRRVLRLGLDLCDARQARLAGDLHGSLVALLCGLGGLLAATRVPLPQWSDQQLADHLAQLDQGRDEIDAQRREIEREIARRATEPKGEVDRG